MDPYVSAEERGLISEARKTDDGTEYLRRLKSQATVEPSATASTVAVAGISENLPAGKDRRSGPRYKCSGSAEFTAEGGNGRLWGALTDVSERGCYVEMSTTFPVDTKVELILDAMGIRFHARSVVRTSYPFLGMGVMLTEIEPDQNVLLERLLAALSKTVTLPQPVTQDRSTTELFVGAEPILFLDEIKLFFDGRAVLSREEFFRIAKRCQRP